MDYFHHFLRTIPGVLGHGNIQVQSRNWAFVGFGVGSQQLIMHNCSTCIRHTILVSGTQYLYQAHNTYIMYHAYLYRSQLLESYWVWRVTSQQLVMQNSSLEERTSEHSWKILALTQNIDDCTQYWCHINLKGNGLRFAKFDWIICSTWAKALSVFAFCIRTNQQL